jgi:DNA-binding transcriptional LysR family regulator
MQLKRLEEATGAPLIDRAGRGVALTAQGEQLAGYARRILALNDEAWGKLTDDAFEGELNFGVPHDVIYPTSRAPSSASTASFPGCGSSSTPPSPPS